MTPVEYIIIKADILGRKDIQLSRKVLLGLIAECNSQGLHISNDAISELLGVKPDTVTKILRDLLGKGLIEIRNPQSRYRKIFYSGSTSRVEAPENDSTPDLNPATPDVHPVYSGRGSEHNTINKKKARKVAQIAFNASARNFIGITQADMQRWSTAYPNINLQTEIAKAADWLIRKNLTRSDYRLFLANWFSRSKPTAVSPAVTVDDIQGDTEEILKKANELGLMIKGTEIYERFEDLSKKLEADEGSRNLLEEYAEVSQIFHEKEERGVVIEVAEKQKLQELNDKISENQLIKEYIATNSYYLNLLMQIQRVISEPTGEPIKESRIITPGNDGKIITGL